MTPVLVVGAGISGLCTAHFLAKRGLLIDLVEKEDRVGGLIATTQFSEGLAESAATSMLATKRVESLFGDLGLKVCRPKRTSRARYIFRKIPRRFPLNFGEVMRLALNLVRGLLRGIGWFRPTRQETVRAYGNRVFGETVTSYLLEAALQGIYAGDISKMSAALIFSGRFRPQTPRGRMRGVLAPEGGMQTLVTTLEKSLAQRGVKITKGLSLRDVNDSSRQIVICTSAPSAAELVRNSAPAASAALSRIHLVPAVSVTLFFPESEAKLEGFGCLFPRVEGFRVLGILFPGATFEGRAVKSHVENWIYGGATDPGAADLTEDEILTLIAQERQRLFGRQVKPLRSFIKIWNHGIPHYDLELEQVLTEGFDLPPNLHLVGNYLGGLGLAKIVETAYLTAEKIANQLGKKAT